MYRLACETITINQATWIRCVRRISFDNLTLQDTEEDFIEGQAVCLCFFVSMVSNADAVISNSINNVLDVHCKTPVSILPDYSTALETNG